MEEINNFQQEPDENLYQAWERFKELLMKCPQHYLTEMQEVDPCLNKDWDILLDRFLTPRVQFHQRLVVDAKVPIQKMVEYSQKWHNGTSRSRSTKTSDGLAAIQAQLNNLGREIKKVNEKDMLLKLDANNAKEPITPKIAHSQRKEKLSKKQCESFVPRTKEIYGRYPEQIHK
ncbi:hypothetical protein Tco_0834402 [Tanacetum coccineum]